MTNSDISEQDAQRLIENRTEFKLYAAEQHLKNLKDLEQSGITMHSSKGRVQWEMEIESFLFHIIGVSDSLQAKTNDKLGLKLTGQDVNMDKIRILLNYLNEQGLLSNLRKLEDNTWFCKLKSWRNKVTHTNLLPLFFDIDVPEKGKPRVFFRDDENKTLEVIQYIGDSLQKVKDLLREIINDEPRLG